MSRDERVHVERTKKAAIIDPDDDVRQNCEIDKAPEVIEETAMKDDDASDTQETSTYQNSEVPETVRAKNEVSTPATFQDSKSTKRYYEDRDEPKEKQRKICWWHKLGECIYGVNCWYTEEYIHQSEEIGPNQPFRPEAQQAWADTSY